MMLDSGNISDITSADCDDDVYVFPATYPQKQLWFLHKLDPFSPAYNIPFTYEVSGALDVVILRKAINEIINRHETFRTNFYETSDGLVQFVTKSRKIDIPVIEIVDSSEKNSEIESLVKEEAVKPFDLTSQALIRGKIIKRSSKSFLILLNFHHIILDHISIVQFSDELETIYNSMLDGKSHGLFKPELHYGDYSVWQTQWQSNEILKPKLKFWKELLKDREYFIDLPTDYKRNPSIEPYGSEYYLHFPQTLANKIKSYNKKNSVSLYITLLSGLGVLLGRITNKNNLLIGTPFANRGTQPELEKVMGCFINTIPIPIEVNEDSSFNEVIKVARKNVLSVNANQEVPFEQIVESVNPKRDSSYNPLFQVSFTFQEPPMQLNLNKLEIKSRFQHNYSAKFDLMFWLWESDDGIRGSIEYNTNLFDRDTVVRLARNYQRLMESAVNNPELPICELDIINESEINTLLNEWNDTQEEINLDDGIQSLLTGSISSKAEEVAIEYKENRLTYNQLEAISNKIANYIISKNIEKSSYIGVCLNRNEKMLPVLLGILKSGCSYLPLDPAFPNDRLTYMLEDSGCKTLFTESGLNDSLENYVDHVIKIDSDWEFIDQASSGNPDVKINKDDIAYIIYTSGSTGKPKGVVVPHGAVKNFLLSMAKEPGLSDNDKVLAITTLSFDISVLELFLPLSVGAVLVIADKNDSSDPVRLAELLKEHNISFMQATPATWRILLTADWNPDPKFKILCGGEPLSSELSENLLSKVNEIWNMYGPTETTVWSTIYKITDSKQPVLIGKPIRNTEVYVCDKHMQLSPIGIPGELYIGGYGVTAGYLNRDELTNERFINNPFKPAAGKLYRTGDIVKYRSDGNLEYINRADNQVKVRGYRIEPGEIDAILEKIPEVKQSVTVVREDTPGDKRLVSYLSDNNGSEIEVNDIRKNLRKFLPDYMIPQHIVHIEEFPLTPNGKIDKKNLPAPFGSSLNDVYVAPRSTEEEKLAEIWKTMIGLDKVSVTDNFFDVGGHSLLSVQVLAKIKELTGVQLNPRVLIQNSLEQIAPLCGFDDLNLVEEEAVQRRDRSQSGFLKKLFMKLNK